MDINIPEKYQPQNLMAAMDARPQAEKVVILVLVVSFLGWLYMLAVYEGLEAKIEAKQRSVSRIMSQITTEQVNYLNMQNASKEDPNKYARDRLRVLEIRLTETSSQIESLAGNLVSLNEMTALLTTVLESQTGLILHSIANTTPQLLRTGTVDPDDEGAGTSGLNIYRQGLVMNFEGTFKTTMAYLLFLENLSRSFFWDTITFTQTEWPKANVRLEIHTLSSVEGFIGV